MIDPGVKVLPSPHVQETLTPEPQGLFGLFNTRDLRRSFTSFLEGIAASVPSGQVQVVGGLQSPQGPFRPLPRKSPRFEIVVPSAQVQVVGRTPAPQGFLLGNVIILNITVNLSIKNFHQHDSIIVNINNLTISTFSTWIPVRQHNHLMNISIPINIVNTASIYLSSSSTLMMRSSPSSGIML